MQDLWRRTAASAAMGNDFVIWSEEALVLHGQAEEAEAVAQVLRGQRAMQRGVGLSSGGHPYVCGLGLCQQQLRPPLPLSPPPSHP